jgi:hypothetical protein
MPYNEIMEAIEPRKPGRPPRYPQKCTQGYPNGSHRFSPKTGRCPCGYQRPDFIAPPSKVRTPSKVLRIDGELNEGLKRAAVRLGKSVRDLVEDILRAFLESQLEQPSNVERTIE